jgi:hypothetical protein
MTIDKLAIMVQEGFMATAKQEDLLVLTRRTDDLTKRMDRIEDRLDKFQSNVDGRFDKVLAELKEIPPQ